jgi:purine operon repressor
LEKIRRLERLVILAKQLTNKPSHLFSLGEFADVFGCAKSTLSEDMSLIRDTLEAQGMGTLETIAGAAGGVRYLPYRPETAVHESLSVLAGLFSSPDRIIPGGFLYMSDVLFSPERMVEAGEFFFQRFAPLSPDYILTIETKGIPLALMTARAFNIPLVIARQGSKVTEGSAVSINYLTGSAKRIQTMSVSRRALPAGARGLVIGDFMKAGGTARGLVDMAAEVGAMVVGTGVLIATDQPEKKLVEDYTALLVLYKIDEMLKQIDIRPAI